MGAYTRKNIILKAENSLGFRRLIFRQRRLFKNSDLLISRRRENTTVKTWTRGAMCFVKHLSCISKYCIGKIFIFGTQKSLFPGQIPQRNHRIHARMRKYERIFHARVKTDGARKNSWLARNIIHWRARENNKLYT